MQRSAPGKVSRVPWIVFRVRESAVPAVIIYLERVRNLRIKRKPVAFRAILKEIVAINIVGSIDGEPANLIEDHRKVCVVDRSSAIKCLLLHCRSKRWVVDGNAGNEVRIIRHVDSPT